VDPVTFATVVFAACVDRLPSPIKPVAVKAVVNVGEAFGAYQVFTQAVVGICVVLTFDPGVGAAGVPVSVGEAKGA
jgi:hypothetical protein